MLNVFVCKFTNLLYYYTTEQYVATYEFQLSLLPDTCELHPRDLPSMCTCVCVYSSVCVCTFARLHKQVNINLPQEKTITAQDSIRSG